MRINQQNLPVQNGIKTDQGQVERKKKLLTACREFEAVFYQQILKQMRESIPQSDWLNGGTGENIFRDFLDEEYAKIMAERNSVGLAELLYRQLAE